jgi:hypothetical protein
MRRLVARLLVDEVVATRVVDVERCAEAVEVVVLECCDALRDCDLEKNGRDDDRIWLNSRPGGAEIKERLEVCSLQEWFKLVRTTISLEDVVVAEACMKLSRS